MISYVILLEVYPVTYNKQPLGVEALASQKHYMSVYLFNIYADPESERWFKEAFRASGKKMDIGKSCVRFRKLDDLPIDPVGQVVSKTPVDALIALYERSRAGKSR